MTELMSTVYLSRGTCNLSLKLVDSVLQSAVADGLPYVKCKRRSGQNDFTPSCNNQTHWSVLPVVVGDSKSVPTAHSTC